MARLGQNAYIYFLGFYGIKMEKQDENFRYIVRVSNTDIDGNRKVVDSIRKIRGIGFSFASAICSAAGIEKNARTGNLSDAEIGRIEDALKNAHLKLPVWMLNRRRNIEDDSSVHLVSNDLAFAQENDIRQMQRIRSYKGIRHMAGAPVRGQRTRSNFRKNKGKVLGVIKSKAAAAAPAKDAKEAGSKEKGKK